MTKKKITKEKLFEDHVRSKFMRIKYQYSLYNIACEEEGNKVKETKHIILKWLVERECNCPFDEV